jgi:hypothetical protein
MSNNEETMNHKFYDEYNNLGGKALKSFEEYKHIYDRFIYYTKSIYIFGECDKYTSCSEAYCAFLDDTKISHEEGSILFDSIDNIAAYS